jgi:hypothetical protein
MRAITPHPIPKPTHTNTIKWCHKPIISQFRITISQFRKKRTLRKDKKERKKVHYFSE